MKKNMGTSDKVIRIVILSIIALLLITKIIVGIMGIILFAIALILLLTSIFGFCPLYSLFGWKTCKKKEAEVSHT